MKRDSFGAYPIAVLLLITGCSTQPGPSLQELKQDLREEISVSIEEFEIEDTENLGTQTEPKIQSRFRATLKFTEEDLSSLSPDFVELYRSDGRLGKEFAEIYGLSTSTRQGSQWETKFVVEEEKNLLRK